ncbi:Uncharacterized protein PCOAH_00028520 [Plasmodium coatneyi]|uniref:Methyltransferase domain-containing protein n=1 Tax=Plasmodium coatneyi TaxID=208452 RepID=A0A1B1E1V0_9APIC|nr:Uncharacterized protein PCOAH_00028520 [Plasmodium coatneyi]ANQ08819.1 Uncharacterized protein PCOAH_00028520 [Plasmodium coatneyi]
MRENRNTMVGVTEHEINIYDERKVHFEALSAFSKSLKHDFKDFVHLICKVKNVRRHGKLLLFCDTISNGKINTKENVLFYRYHVLKYDDVQGNPPKGEVNSPCTGDNNEGAHFCVVENKFNEESLSEDKNIQLVISKDFYVDEDKFDLFRKSLLEDIHTGQMDNKDVSFSSDLFEHSVRLSKEFYADVKRNENVQTSTEEGSPIKDNSTDNMENDPVLLVNEYIKYEILRKVIKTDTLLYIIGLPALTNTNEKSLLVFSAYLLKVNYEFFNINELLKLFEGGFFSMLTVCRSLQMKEISIRQIYNSKEDTKRRFIRSIIYKNKNYESISNQKMNNFEIFILKIIDVIPKLFEIEPSEFNYKMEMNDDKRLHRIMLCDLNLNQVNDHVVVDTRASGDATEQTKKKKKKPKKKKKKDITSYMNNKKMPQVQWMINHIKILLEEIEERNSKIKVFSGGDIFFHMSTLVNKYIESNDTFFQNYLEFIELFMEKNDQLVSEENTEKIRRSVQLLREKNVNLFENSKWSDVQFYDIRRFYVEGCTKTSGDLIMNCKRLDEENTPMNYDRADGVTFEEEQNVTPKMGKSANIDCDPNLTYDYCILDVGGGKGDLGIHISLAFKNVLVIILDINVNSLFSCFIKIFANKIKNVLIMHESILNFDFKKYKINLIVGLHSCGGLTDYILRTCVEERIPFLTCSCCYTKYRELRKHIFDFNNDMIVNQIESYIYKGEYYAQVGYSIGQCAEDTGGASKGEHTDVMYAAEGSTEEVSHLNMQASSRDGKTHKDGDGGGDMDDVAHLGDLDDFSIYKKRYDKYGKKIMRRTIPNIYSFVNLLSKLCESENAGISFKCMHFYNNLRFQILQKLFSATGSGAEGEELNLSLHSFPMSFSPKNIVLKGVFSKKGVVNR